MAVSWDIYNVEIQINDRLVGGIPIVPEGEDRADAYERGWLKKVEDDPEFEKPLAEALAEDPDMPTKPVSVDDIGGLETGFRRDDEGIYIEARQVKAMLREAAQRLGFINNIRGARQVLQHDLNVRAETGSFSQKLRLYNEDGTNFDPDGKDMRPISVITAQGPRTAIKRFEYSSQPRIRFIIRVLAGGIAYKGGKQLIGEAELADMLDFAQDLGLGADRSQGEGTYTLISLEKIENGSSPAKGKAA
jgi:hypothetical protein